MIHENTILFDEHDNPNCMIKFTPDSDNPEPMFKIGDKIAKAVYISKYLNTDRDGVPCSLPCSEPMRNISFEDAEKKCREKGEGWHMLTNTEWMYLYNESVKNNTIPHGNTKNGAYAKDESERGTNVKGSGTTLTGTGPVTWNHDHTAQGVADLCGNVWEMVTGLRLCHGAIEYIENNNAAIGDTGEISFEWEQLKIGDEEVCFSVNDEKNTVTIRKGAKHTGWNGVCYKELKIKKKVMAEVGDKLREIGVIPEDYKNEEAYIWVDTDLSEAIAYRGSSFRYSNRGGVAALRLNLPRARGGNLVGFRSAYVEL